MSLRSRWMLSCALSMSFACAHETPDTRVPEPAQPAVVSHEVADESAAFSPKQDLLEAPAVSVPAPGDGTQPAPEEPLPPRGAGREGKGTARSAGVVSSPGVFRASGMGVGGGGYGVSGLAAPLAKQKERDDGLSREAYAHLAEGDFMNVRDEPLSTFSVDVDTASYSNVRRFLRDGSLPPPDAVRIEELVNYFDYDYPAPQGAEPFSLYAEVSDCPWNQEHRLVHVGIQGRAIEQAQVPARNLVFLVDVSGSMQSPDKLPLLKSGLTLLARNLREQDRVSLVVYAGAAGLVLPATSGSHTSAILSALDRLEAGGSTNGAGGIELAYAEAQRHFVPGGVNRVILATDGDFNVGPSSEGELVRIIEDKRKSGVFLTVLGFGTGNLQDSRMEQLADKGNGNYAYIDTLDEARKVLVREAGSTLVTIAKDVKLQVEFNPAHVASYRLVGYENRALAARDFNDDKKDAGEIGAGHTVTALYEIAPVGSDEALAQPAVDALRYQAERGDAPGAESGELLTVKVRYKAPNRDDSQLVVQPLKDQHRALADASPTFRFSAAVAGFGMLLRGSKYRGSATLPALRELAESAASSDPHGEKGELLDMMRAAQRLGLGG